MHENGPWKNEDGLLINQYTDGCVNAYDMAVLVDLDTGSVLKHGDETMCTKYMATYTTRISKLFPEDIPNLVLVKFNDYRNLTPDEVCTFVNYLNNSIGPEKMEQMLHPESLEALKTKLQSLNSVGF